MTPIELKSRKSPPAPCETLESYTSVLQRLSLGILIVDEYGVIHFTNSAMNSMLGYLDGELLGSSVSRINAVTPQKDSEAVAKEIMSSLMRKSFWYGEVRNVRKDGVEFVSSVIVNELMVNGQRFFLSEQRDVSRYLDSLEALKESEQKFRRLVGAAFEGIAIIQDGVLVEVNESFLRTLAYNSFEEVIGRPAIDFVSAEDIPTVRNHIASNYELPYEFVALRKDGVRVHVEVSGKSIVYHGRPARVSALRDVSGRKLAERMLRERADELLRSNKELEQFAYVASHDLQEPLRMISTYIEMLARKNSEHLDETSREFMSRAVNGAKRMKHLIDDLLRYARLGKDRSAFQWLDMGTVVTDVTSDLQVAIRECNAGVTCGEMPQVFGDVTQLRQLFQNLISNSLKFRSSDAPEISISAERIDEDWVIKLSDNGIGFEMKYAERVFVIFQRLHSPEHYPGTGIGLALCKKIVERHGGRIWVKSDPGEGTQFYFTLPCR